MRKIVVAVFVSVDGVMQAPGGPDEDRSGDFAHGGWVAGYFDEVVGASVGEAFARPFDLLLGRKTYDIFAAHWPRITDPKAEDYPIAETFNRVRKYVLTHRPDALPWSHSEALKGDPAAAIRNLKREDGPDLLTQGSSELLHLLFAHDLVDELHLLTFPILLGKGKRVFDGKGAPAGLRLASSRTSPNGVVIGTYARHGEVKTGSFALPEP